MTPLHELLGEFGVAAPDLDKARAYQQKYGGRIEQILVNMGSLSADALPGIYGRLLGAELLPARFSATWEPPAGLEALPVDFLLVRGWLPVAREDDRWVFAAHAPLDLEVNEWLGGLAEPYVLRLVSEEQFDALKARLGRRQDAAAESSLSSVEEGRLRELASEAPTVNLLNTLIARALKQGASDMHIEPQGSRARVRFRIDGVLHEVDVIAPAMVLPVITRLKILAGMDIGERRRPQDMARAPCCASCARARCCTT